MIMTYYQVYSKYLPYETTIWGYTTIFTKNANIINVGNFKYFLKYILKE